MWSSTALVDQCDVAWPCRLLMIQRLSRSKRVMPHSFRSKQVWTWLWSQWESGPLWRFEPWSIPDVNFWVVRWLNADLVNHIVQLITLQTKRLCYRRLRGLEGDAVGLKKSLRHHPQGHNNTSSHAHDEVNTMLHLRRAATAYRLLPSSSFVVGFEAAHQEVCWRMINLWGLLSCVRISLI